MNVIFGAIRKKYISNWLLRTENRKKYLLETKS